MFELLPDWMYSKRIAAVVFGAFMLLAGLVMLDGYLDSKDTHDRD